MRHDIRADGFGATIRPVTLDDAEFIVSIRTAADRTKYLNPISSDVEAQRRWIAEYLERPDDYYFIVERRRDARPEGAVGLYRFDHDERSAEWGRWILRPGSVAATATAYLIYDLAFERLGLRRVYGRTVVENTRVVAFHDSCGLERTALFKGAFNEGGRALDVVEQSATLENWPNIRRFLRDHATAVAKRLER